MLSCTGRSSSYKPRLKRPVLKQQHDPEQKLDAFLDGTMDADAFWQHAKTNLQAGRVRLLFVADDIPPELRRVVEFLNAQMDPAEVLAIEIKQYVGHQLTTLVPRVVGQTAEARQKRSSVGRAGASWNESSFFTALAAHGDEHVITAVHKVLAWARDRSLRI